MRFVAFLFSMALASSGCGESPAVAPADAGRDASVDLDGGVDLDGAVDDGGILPDGGVPDGGGSWCMTSVLCPSCPDPTLLCDAENPCATGEVCVPTGCEDFSRCFVAGGGACSNDEDCADPSYACEPTIGRCLRVVPGCDDSNDCIAGFACENGVCVDRRVPCETPEDCPHGFRCFFASPDQRFCRRIARPCADDLDCLTLGVPCGDPDGNGARECMPSLMPNEPDAVSCANSQCTAAVAPVCEPTVQGTRAVCGLFGPCVSADDCALGFECRDLWGDGRPECVLTGGTCTDDPFGCAERTVCASSRAGQAPACLGGAVQ